MAITKILNIQESDGRNPASHLKNALEYIQNPDKTEECVLVGSINCLPDTALSRWRRRRIYFIRQVKGMAIMRSYHFTGRKSDGRAGNVCAGALCKGCAW